MVVKMNELIAQLAEQAAQATAAEPNEVNLEVEVDDTKFQIPGNFIEKFAELMVIEFSDVVKQTAILVAQTAYSDGEDAVSVQKRVAGTLRVLDVMRERFGVEE